MVTIGSLFSGIGGLELGLGESMGAHPIWQIENDRHAQTILDRHWPLVPTYGDITEIDFDELEPPDILCGGFPCQDISGAGLKAGIEGAKSGLWKEFFRAIRVLRPRVIVVENVSALLIRGFDRVAGDLAKAGYDMRWSCLRSSDIGAPHRRERLFIVAHPKDYRFDRPRGTWVGWDGSIHSSESATNTIKQGPQRSEWRRVPMSASGDLVATNAGDSPIRELTRETPESQSGIRGGGIDNRFSGLNENRPDQASPNSATGCAWDFGRYSVAVDRWSDIHGPCPDPKDDRGRLNPRFVEWIMGFDAGWVEGIPYTAQLRCLGNAVQPQVAALIGVGTW